MNGISKRKCGCGEYLVEELNGKPRCYNDRCEEGAETLGIQRAKLASSGNHNINLGCGSGCLWFVFEGVLFLALVKLAIFLWYL